MSDPIAAPTALATEARRTPSAARLAANRANAQKSTGPRTEAGKARSRQNALKHGLAGAGICLPSEDGAQVQERCLQLHEEMAPQTIRGMMLVETIAVSYTRMQRARRQEVAALTYAQRCAPILYDDARLTEAEEDLRLLGVETRTRHRHLLCSPEGIDLLIERLGDVRREVRNPNIRWNYIHGQCLEHFCGRDYSDHLTHSRGRALSLALEFEDTELSDADRAEIASPEWSGRIKEWAKPQMEALIDAEIARLESHRTTLDHEGVAQTRAQAAERAMFDAGRDASLARRYEAAATRTFFRALKEFDRIEAGIDPDPTEPSALDEPSAAAAEALEVGDNLKIADPADAAARPVPERRSFERPPLASFGITAEQASREISQPHYSRPPVPFDQPAPPPAEVWGCRS